MNQGLSLGGNEGTRKERGTTGRIASSEVGRSQV